MKTTIAYGQYQAAEAASDTATQVRYLLQELEAKSPGGTVEVRVPPFGAVQVIEGMNHHRGTPPNVVETNPETWLLLARGRTSWEEAKADGKISASGAHADDVARLLPVI